MDRMPVVTTRRLLSLTLGAALAAAGVASVPANPAAAAQANCARADHTVAIGGGDGSITTHVEWCWTADQSTVTSIEAYAPPELEVAPDAPFTGTLRDEVASIEAGTGRYVVTAALRFPLMTCLAVVEGSYFPGGRSDAQLRTPMLCLL
jgi:hypothetical protein